jgi:hypothetical protein
MSVRTGLVGIEMDAERFFAAQADRSLGNEREKNVGVLRSE